MQGGTQPKQVVAGVMTPLLVCGAGREKMKHNFSGRIVIGCYYICTCIYTLHDCYLSQMCTTVAGAGGGARFSHCRGPSFISNGRVFFL